jgi:hypothetical protein
VQPAPRLWLRLSPSGSPSAGSERPQKRLVNQPRGTWCLALSHLGLSTSTERVRRRGPRHEGPQGNRCGLESYRAAADDKQQDLPKRHGQARLITKADPDARHVGRYLALSPEPRDAGRNRKRLQQQPVRGHQTTISPCGRREEQGEETTIDAAKAFWPFGRILGRRTSLGPTSRRF